MSNLIIRLTIDDYLELVERSKAAGVKEGESMQVILDEMINEGRIKSVIQTERSQEQIKKDLGKNWKVWEVKGK